jgi:hypothetical protein
LLFPAVTLNVTRTDSPLDITLKGFAMQEVRKWNLVEEIISSKFESRQYDVLSQSDCELLDDLFGEDRVVCSFPGSSTASVGRGVPSGGHRPAVAVDSPPTTNRGVSKHVGGEKAAEIPASADLHEFGGFDGGTEIGFEVSCDSEKFPVLIESLELAKSRASDSPDGTFLTELFGHEVLVDAIGARNGMFYPYKFRMGGVTFFIARKSKKGYQGVRVRYGATALIGRSLYDVHAAVLLFLGELGFTVLNEKISRADFQVTLEMECSDLLGLIYGGHAVSKVRNDVLYRNSGVSRTYACGQRGRQQLMIYFKTSELKKMAVSNPSKFQLVVEEQLGGSFDFNTSLTRVEFRLWRDVLRLYGVDTIADLRRMETDIVAYLTSKWFRVLSVPKSDVKGHEFEASVHPVWVRVQESFRRFFPGDGKPVEVITLRRDKPISCEPEALSKQAAGCLESMLALEYGDESSMETIYAALFDWIDNVKHSLFSGLTARAHKLGVETGVKVFRSSIQEKGRAVCESWIHKLKYERGRCFG